MDQRPTFPPPPGIGHNQPPEPLDPSAGLAARLAETHADLVARFHDLELACMRAPDPIESESYAAVATDFIAQCRTHIRKAGAVHKKEKDPFLAAGRVVDAFFKRRVDRLAAALAPVVSRLGVYRDRVAAAERERHRERQRAAEEAARLAMAEAADHRAEAERLAREARNFEDRRRAAEHLEHAEAALDEAEAARHEAEAPLEPTRLHGDYGATAHVSRSWTFEVVDLDRVPREYLSLDVAAVRDAIAKQGVRDIPGPRIFQAETLRVRGTAA